MRSSRQAFRRLPLVVAIVAGLSITAAQAQEQQPAPAEEEQPQETRANATQLDTITVTGSLLRRTEYESTSPIQVITADTSIALGQVDTAEFLQKSSIAAGSMQISQQFSGFVVEGGTGVQSLSLRGLGANRTLVLLDGQRPGPAGTRGQVGAFDLNVIPSSIIQRAEIVKDGSSSIYGSDAVAGVVNVITRKTVDRPEITVNARVPFETGGEIFTVSGATGWNFDSGSIVLAGEYYLAEALKDGDRDFFRCPQELVWDADGNRIDREDRSILAGTSLGGCTTTRLYANSINDAITGVRYIPSPDGVTIGPFPGYRPRTNQNFTATNPQAYYEDVTNFDFLNTADIINRQERFNLFASSDFGFDSFNWKTTFLYNHRETEARGFRQFFPYVGGQNGPYQYANSPGFVNPLAGGLAQVIMPFRSDQDISIDYMYLATKLDGLLSFTDTWAWEANATGSRSDGDYSAFSIVGSRTGDWQWSDDAPTLDYFDPGFLSGERMDELASVIGEWHTGNTVYDQYTVNGLVTGEVFELPAGPVAAAVGFEYRRYSIDDQPSALSRNGDLWGQSSAQVTKGKDSVKEAVLEFEVPVLKGVPGFESLTFNGSTRVFQYDTVDGTDNVWKMGLNWQIIPSLRARATRGTSFRAPGLYELYLGNQTGFLAQTAVDPCVEWGDSTNDFIRANCQAAGIAPTYTGLGTSSATVVSGGGVGILKPETSMAKTVGVVFTPEFANISIAVDYFDIDVRDQIAQLGAYDILFGCYGSPVYPNNFCDLFERNPANHASEPNKITTIDSQYVNVNRQRTRGYDLIVNYDDDFSFGKLRFESQLTYTKEDVSQLFDSAAASGQSKSDNLGYIGRPRLVGSLSAQLVRGDMTYTWGTEYVGSTKNLDINEEFIYLGRPNSFRDITAEDAFYHSASVRYDQTDWSLLVGIRNVFDKQPPQVSTGTATRYGNVPAFATQYDYFGRTAFARVTYRF
ncbi:MULTISPECIES: TonB-dependent receptor domain-containing protein [unclassified Luteimonas]